MLCNGWAGQPCVSTTGLDSPHFCFVHGKPWVGWTALCIHHWAGQPPKTYTTCGAFLLQALCPVSWTAFALWAGQPLPCELDSSGRPLAMALFQVALDNIHMAKMWSGELDRSICNFYDRIQYGRKQIVKDLHDEYHRMPGMVAWGKFFAHLCLKWLAPQGLSKLLCQAGEAIGIPRSLVCGYEQQRL